MIGAIGVAPRVASAMYPSVAALYRATFVALGALDIDASGEFVISSGTCTLTRHLHVTGAPVIFRALRSGDDCAIS